MKKNSESFSKFNAEKRGDTKIMLYPNKLFNDNTDEEFKQGEYAIASRTYMRGLILGTCDNFKRPVVILQKKTETKAENSKCFKCNENTQFCSEGKYSRLESSLFYDNWAIFCKKIRIKDHKNFCCRQDEIVADYLLENKNKLNDGDKFEISNGGTTIKGIAVKEKSTNPHVCIRYECPRSHYDELAVNININNIEGVMIIGQFLFDDTPASQLEAFSNTVIECFNNDVEAEEKDKILATEKTDYQNAVLKVFEKINEFEDALKQEYESKIQDNIRTIQDHMVSDFNSYYRRQTPAASQNSYTDEVTLCNEKYELLKKALGKSLRVFANALKSDDAAKIYCYMPDGLYFESEYSFYEYENKMPIESESIIDYIKCNLLKESWFVKNNYSIYKQKLDLHEEKYIYIIFRNIAVDESIKKLFGSYMQFICLEITQLYAQYNGAQITYYTKIMRHELGQLNEAILIRISTFEEAVNKQNVDNYTYDFIHECEHAINDYKSHAHSTMLRCNSSRYFSLLPSPHKELFYPYESFLYKWKFIYAKAAKNKRIDFVMDPVSIYDLSRPRMYADKAMVEQVAYNLTNNALKYSVPGTTITIDCKLNDTKDYYQLIFTNYGRPIREDEKEKIFQCTYRGSNQNEANGSGLGLYLSRKIAEKHDGALELYTEKVSDFDVSCLYLYGDMREKFIDETEKGAVDAEIDRLKTTNFSDEIRKAQFSNEAFTPYYIKKYLKSGTMKYKFVFSIPYKR